MDIDVHQPLRESDIQHAGREFAHHGQIFICLLQRRLHGFGADGTAVDEEILTAAVAPAVSRIGYEAAHAHSFVFGRYFLQA